jgi:hypothetical protein
MKLLCYDPKKNKQVLVGELIGNTLFRDVEPEHFMRIVQGYGIQEVAFQEILKKEVKFIILKETHTDKRWKADVETWKKKGKVADYGHGKQRFLSLSYMNDRKNPIDLREEKEIKRSEQVQLNLSIDK